MTIDTTDNTKTYTGDNSTDVFSFPYLVYEASHVSITLDGVASSAWSATGYGNAAGISITFDSAPATDVAIVIQRIVPYTQETDLENFDGNPSDVTEKEFDLLVMADQQLAEQLDRSILTPIGTTITTNTISGTIDTTTRALTITTSGIATADLANLVSDVDIVTTSLASGDILQYDGSNFVNITQAALSTALSLEVGTDVQAYDAGLASIAGLTTSANQGIYTTALDTYATYSLAALGREIGGLVGSLQRGNGGLVLSNDTDTDHDINITAGWTFNHDGTSIIELTSEITKQIDVTWASGDDAGGLSSSLSAPANSTWYHLFAIVVSGSVDVGFDTSTTAANLVADHSATDYAYLGSVLTDGSANILAFYQHGREFVWDNPVVDVAAANPSTTRQTPTISTPLGFVTMAHCRAYLQDNSLSAATYIFVEPVEITNTAPADAQDCDFGLHSTNTPFEHIHKDVVTNTSSQIAYRISQSTADHTMVIRTYGYTNLAI